MAKPKKCPEPEECPEWIFTFADLVMLMMGFFVILWVLKPNETKPGAGEQQSAAEKKWLETVAEIRKPFGWVPDPLSSDPVDKYALARVKPTEGAGGETKETPNGAKGTEPLVTNVRPGVQVAIGGRMGFDVGDAAMNAETTRVANEIYERLKGHRNIIQVKGHAALDDFPDGTASQRFMDLSLRRAQAIADHLLSRGLSPDVVRVQGCSTFEPIVQRTYGPDAQALNRRVEVEATNVTVPERQDPTKIAEPPKVGSGAVEPNKPAQVNPAAH